MKVMYNCFFFLFWGEGECRDVKIFLFYALYDLSRMIKSFLHNTAYTLIIDRDILTDDRSSKRENS